MGTNQRAWALVTPSLLLLLLVGGVPLLTVINFSFHDVFTSDQMFWVGADWYREILQSDRFYNSLGRSFLFSVLILAIEIPLGIYLALCLPKRGAGVSFSLICLAMPLLVPWNMISLIWISVLNEQNGILGMVLSGLGFHLDWKFNPIHTWFAIVMIDVWHWTSLVAILCYSSLTTIPSPFYQAAAIDGASRLQVFRFIELPKMKNVLMMALLLRFMDSFMIYIEPFRFNAGGPDNTTMFLAMDLGEDVAAFNYGPSAARSVIYFVFILCVAWAFNTALNHQSRDNQKLER